MTDSVGPSGRPRTARAEPSGRPEDDPAAPGPTGAPRRLGRSRLSTVLGIGISTTHTITGSIVGVGATRRLSAVRWGVASQIVWAWVLTIPAAAFVGASTYWMLAMFGAD